jgi:hypothetical protein
MPSDAFVAVAPEEREQVVWHATSRIVMLRTGKEDHVIRAGHRDFVFQDAIRSSSRIRREVRSLRGESRILKEARSLFKTIAIVIAEARRLKNSTSA